MVAIVSEAVGYITDESVIRELTEQQSKQQANTICANRSNPFHERYHDSPGVQLVTLSSRKVVLSWGRCGMNTNAHSGWRT